MQADGPAALVSLLQQRAEPLARVVIDAHLDRHAAKLRHAEGQLNALRGTASYVAGTLPAEVAQKIAAISGGQQLRTIDEHMRPIANPELASIALVLPAGPICQIVRIAERLGVEYSEVTAAVANAAITSISQQRSAIGRGTQPGAEPGPGLATRPNSRDFPHAPHHLRKADRGPPTPSRRATATSRPTRRSPR